MSVKATASADREPILERVREWMESDRSKYSTDFQCEWLPGDASNRFYGRLKFASGAKLMLMVMNAPEAFKSEEKTGANETMQSELPFVTIGRELEKAKVRVPRIMGVDPRSEFLLSEDLGDELLYTKRQIEPASIWYERALDELIRLQKVTPFTPVAERSFTDELLSWEGEHFVEYMFLKRDKNVSKAVLDELRNFLKKIVDRMTASKYILVHRDYHSKNLLVLEDEKRVGVIDFQDALMGPPTYDLASLLRDSYVALDDKEEKHFLDYFEKNSKTPLDRELFNLTSLQRNMKAAGRFYYISIVKKKDTHLPYVAPTLKRIFKTLKDLNELRLLSLLEGLLKDEASS
jgi:aminoglycoside/choline kinase family phosphotransferase